MKKEIRIEGCDDWCKGNKREMENDKEYMKEQ